jgi:hypothetical protein
MNDLVWRTENDPLILLEELYPMRGLDSAEPQSRQSRLYLIACARRAWDQLPGVCRALVRVAEDIYRHRVANRALRDRVYPFAEGLFHCGGEIERMNEIGRELVRLKFAEPAEARIDATLKPATLAGFGQLAYGPYSPSVPAFQHIPIELHGADLVREIFVNPFRPLYFDPTWLTSTVIALARGTHEERAFDRLPILADALQDAGCDNDEILDHMRDPKAAHATGCWALELVLYGRGRRSLPA